MNAWIVAFSLMLVAIVMLVVGIFQFKADLDKGQKALKAKSR